MQVIFVYEDWTEGVGKSQPVFNQSVLVSLLLTSLIDFTHCSEALFIVDFQQVNAP